MPSDTPRPVPPVPRLAFTPDGVQEPHPILDVDTRALRAGYRTLPIREHLATTAAARRGWFAVWGPRGATHAPIPHAVCPGCGCLVPVAPYLGDGHHPTAGAWSLELPAHMRRTAKSGAGWRACHGARVEGPGVDPAAVSPTTGTTDPRAQTDNLVRGIRRVEDELGDALNRARPALTWDTAIDNGRRPCVREGIAAALDTRAPGKGYQRREMYLRPRALLSAGYRAGGVVAVPADGVAWELLCVGLVADAKAVTSDRIVDAISRAILGPSTLQWEVCPALVSAVFHRESVVGFNAGVTGRAGTAFPPVGPGAFTLPHVVTHAKMGLDGVPADPADIGAVGLYLHPLALEVVAVALRMALSPPPPSHHAAQALGWIEYRPDSVAPWLYLTPFGEERLRACLAACLLALGVMPLAREYPGTGGGATPDYAARIEAAWAAVQLAPQDGGAVTRALGVVMAPWVAEVGDGAVARFRWRGMGDTSGVEYPAALGFDG